MDSKRILIITQDFPPITGGIQTMMFELAQGFLAQGHSVTVICPGDPSTPSPLPPSAKVERIRIHTSWLFVTLIFRLRGILKTGNFTHVLYAQWQASLAEALIPKSHCRHQSYCLFYGREILTSALGPFRYPALRLALRRLDFVLPISRATRDLLLNFGKPYGKVEIVHPAVNPDLFKPGELNAWRKSQGIGDGPVILSVGRMVLRKNMSALIHVFPAILKRFPDAWLVLAGKGPERESLKSQAKNSFVGERILFPEVKPHAEFIAEFGASIYCLADVFAMVALNSKKDLEGFGIVYLEAGACEIPVIGSRVGGIPDAVVEGETGILVYPDNAEELENALIDLLSRADRGKSMGIAARRRILNKLSWQHSVKQVLSLME